jgi:hypothetical protein
LLVVGPALGTTVEALWAGAPGSWPARTPCSAGTCPGTAAARPPDGPFAITDLGDAVLALADSPFA